MQPSYPERIVCLTEETTETLYMMGEQWRIVGISGFTVRPPQARKEKPKVAAFTTAKIDQILALQPDLVLGFSDLQADIAAELIRAGVAVHVFNHRSVAGILSMVQTLGGLIGKPEAAADVVQTLNRALSSAQQQSEQWAHRPKVYFEEWDEPMISGIQWVSELVAWAGGDDCFAELACAAMAKDRIIADPSAVVSRAPDIIIGSWCGKKFRPEQLQARSGFANIPAVQSGHVYEIKSPLILQPGPAAILAGLPHLQTFIARWHSGH